MKLNFDRVALLISVGIIAVLLLRAPGSQTPDEQAAPRPIRPIAKKTQSPSTDPSQQWTKAGVIGIDSGQVAILDPGYIEKEWVAYEDGSEWSVDFWGRDQQRATSDFGKPPISCENRAQAEALAARIDAWCKDKRGFVQTQVRFGCSFDRCCDLSAKGFGQLNYRRGHAGLGVVSTTGQGDGSYDVFARYSASGSIAELRVVFEK